MYWNTLCGNSILNNIKWKDAFCEQIILILLSEVLTYHNAINVGSLTNAGIPLMAE